MRNGDPKLLLVDDETDVLDSLKRDLEGNGYQILTAQDGKAALEAVRSEAPNLILLDLMLPTLDGYHLLKLIKSDERFRGIPVLVVTARADIQDLTLAMECGAERCVVKPVQREALLEVIRALLPGGGPPRPGGA
ncbi:MAG: response regulator [Candidatus Omnitrophica bacterium]|nr:response regulator [Candidatus Omnitrophota bacterium]